MNTGQKIKFSREEQGLSQEALAKKVGVTRAAISYWETGVTRNLNGTHLLNLAKALKKEPIWFLEQDDLEPPTLPSSPFPTPGALEKLVTVTDTLAAMKTLVHRAHPEMRSDVIKLIMHYIEKPELGESVVKAVEALTAH